MPIVGMVVSYETPLGFHHYASDFAWWAERARERKTEFYTPTPYYLYCRALELALKSYLLAQGVSKKRIKTRKLGHNLVALLDLATKLGIVSYLAIKPIWRLHLTQGSVIYRAKSLNDLKKHGVLTFSVWWCYHAMHGAPGSPDLRR